MSTDRVVRMAGAVLAISAIAINAPAAPPKPGTSKPAAVEAPPKEFMGLPLLFVEEFDQPVPDQWVPTDPAAWKFTTDGQRTVYALFNKSRIEPPVRSPLGIALRKDVYLSDLVLDVWMRSTVKDYPHRDMCVILGHQDPTHFYYVHLGTKPDPVSNNIHIVDGKPRRPLLEPQKKGTPWTDGYHHVRVVRDVAKGTITAYFDDMAEPHLAAKDTTFKWGQIGVGSFDDTGNIDRVVLWGRRVEPPGTTTGPVGGRTQGL